MAHDPLFTSASFGTLALKHRVVMAPLTRMRARQPGNIPHPLNAEYYEQRASEGSLQITEATDISARARGYRGVPGIYSQQQIEGWRRVTNAVHAKGGLIVNQIWHVGRASHSSLLPDRALPVAPSAIAAPGEHTDVNGNAVPFETPRALSVTEIDVIKNEFVQAALNARRAGFDAVEIHGANGYLIDQFLHNGSNQRTDTYGGPIENRSRFLLEVVDAVTKAIGADRVGVRLSPWSNILGMFDTDGIALWEYVVSELGKRNLAYLHLIEPRADFTNDERPLDMDAPDVAQLFKTVFGGPVISAGGYTPETARQAIASGNSDAIAFGRLFIANPDLPERIRQHAPLNTHVRATFYGGGKEGYTDYPFLQPSVHSSSNGAKKHKFESSYDFIICGAGTAGCVVAARLAEDHDAQVLLIEAGGGDSGPAVMDPAQWPLNLGGERDWAFESEPNMYLNGRRLPLNMGKMLGGSSSINVMVWARGHKTDWDHFAAESGDPNWGYESVLGYYRRIENWQGAPDKRRRGNRGPVYVASPANPQPLANATVAAARALGIPYYESANGEMMEGAGGVALADLRIREGKRESIYRSYIHPRLQQTNLTVLTNALVCRLLFNGKKAAGVEVLIDGKPHKFEARCETILSLGAVNTPKVLMQSGVGPRSELQAHGINLVQHLPGVGQNHQDHIAFGCTWEYLTPQRVNAGGCESTLYWKSKASLEAPDLLHCQLEFAVPSPVEVGIEPPEHGWTMFAGLARPRSRGVLRLSGSGPLDAVKIEPNYLSAPEDMAAALATVELSREIGNHTAFGGLIKREAIPGNRNTHAMKEFIRNSAVTFWHQSCTAKMGRDSMSVVDSQLRVHGIQNLRIADASVFPRIPVGNIMAPCVVVGERAADMIRATQGLNSH